MTDFTPKIETNIIRVSKDHSYLSEIMNELPSGVLLDKGITGCGGTTVEMNSKRNSILLFPTVGLVENKVRDTDLAVMGGITLKKIEDYIKNDKIKYKKIIATYDAFVKILEFDLYDWFLLIDEYHLLFNLYSFRNKAIMPILNNFKKFKNYCFMTATPLTKDNLLEELKDIPQIKIEWENSIPVNVHIIDTFFTTKSLLNEFIKYPNDNYHIFLNSIKTITSIVSNLSDNTYKIVCSKSQKLPHGLKRSTTKDPVKKYNFYTSTAFEGQDVLDPIGRTFILSDTNISTTILDISTLSIQICGRLRDSQYKDQITLILNTRKHRYAKMPFPIFENKVRINKETGNKALQIYEDNLNNPKFKREDVIKIELKKFNPESYFNIYLNIKHELLILDLNLIKTDYANYKNVNDIYNKSINVINTYKKNFDSVTVEKQKEIDEFSEWYSEFSYIIMPKLVSTEYTFEELKNLYEKDFLECGIKFTRGIIKKHFPPFIAKQLMKNNIKSTYYIFKI